MFDEIILHIGMHKTGSSSIQDTLHSISFKDTDDIQYLKLQSPNHSSAFMTMFLSDPSSYHEHIMLGRDNNAVEKIKEHHIAYFDNALKSTHARRIIISAEDLSAPTVDESMLRRIKEKLLCYTDTIKVIGYIRKPVEYMQSAFQQRVKAGVLNNLNLLHLWPSYKARFESVDTVFGRENVELLMYEPSTFKEGDVVQDFISRLNLSNKIQVKRSNDSISLESTAILFLLNKYIEEVKNEDFSKKRAQLVSKLSSIGTQKLHFSQELLTPVLNFYEFDLKWAMNRITDFELGSIPNVEYAIKSEQHLEAIALSEFAKVWELTKRNNVCQDFSNFIDLMNDLEIICMSNKTFSNSALFPSEIFLNSFYCSRTPTDILKSFEHIFQCDKELKKSLDKAITLIA